MRKLFKVLVLISFACVASAQSPYSGEEQREIKALSEKQVKDYLAGSGMGYAKAAELNSYPGPRHVLELAGELALSEQQMTVTGKIFDTMQLQAKKLGQDLVRKEAELDQLFSDNTITASTLRIHILDIAELQGQIRFAHLAAHIEQKSVLSESQSRHYDRLRGYAGGHATHQH